MRSDNVVLICLLPPIIAVTGLVLIRVIAQLILDTVCAVFVFNCHPAFAKRTAFQSPVDGLDPRHYAIGRLVETRDMVILCTGRTDNRSESKNKKELHCRSLRVRHPLG